MCDYVESMILLAKRKKWLFVIITKGFWIFICIFRNNLLNAAKESDDVERAPLPSSSRRLNSRSVSEILSDTPQLVRSIVTIWRNGFTLDDHPLSTLDDPDNAIFLEV